MKSVLITGGTGSFGRAFVNRLLADGIERIRILSRGEHAQAEMLDGLPEDRIKGFIGDVRDRDRLRQAFDGVDTVIHAAALKRIETCRYNAEESVKTNIDGARNVISAAQSSGVKKVVALSSDKAFEPISAYGRAKALAEDLFINADEISRSTRFRIVRYGNIAGSRGSVIPKWRALINQGLPIEVTDVECTRFWMFQQEAVALVLKAIDANNNDILIPTLPAYRVGDLVEVMKPPKIIFKGLPKFEKLHEGMAPGNTSDKARRMDHQEISEGLQQL